MKTILSRLKPTLRHVGILLVLCASARATIIQPNTATASTTYQGENIASHTIDGSGLQGPVATLPTHSVSSTLTHWLSSNQGLVTDQYITWGFSSPQTLDTIYLWNAQAPHYEVGEFALTFYNAAAAIIGTYSGTLAFGSNAAQPFGFSPLAGVSSVRLDVNGYNTAFAGSGNYVGLAEVAFRTGTVTGVPDGGTTATLLGLGLFGLAFCSRRRSLA
ncbi:MAG: VPDSG-CTERM sorting domain-containing protein [Opitutaceae bacterium]